MPRDLFASDGTLAGNVSPLLKIDQPARTPGDPNAYWPYRMGRDLFESFKSAAMLPGQVMSGEKPIADLTPADTLNFSLVANPVNPAVRAGDRAIPGEGLARYAGAPSEEAIRGAALRDLNSFRKSGVYIKGDRIKTFSADLKNVLDAQGLLELDAPSTYNLINKKLANPPQDAVLDPTAFHSFRRRLGDIAKRTKEGKATDDAVAASIAIKELDQFWNRLPDEGFVADSPAAIAKARADFARFRGNYSVAEQSRKVTTAAENAELGTAAANSGANIDNKLRQTFVAILKDPKRRRSYPADALNHMRAVVYGTRTQNNLRRASNVLGGGGGLGQLATMAVGSGAGGGLAGLLGGGPVGALIGGAIGLGAPALAGAGMKGMENALARRSVSKLDEALRARSPQAIEGGPYQGPLVSSAQRAALLRVLPLIAKSNPQAALDLWIKANPNSL